MNLQDFAMMTCMTNTARLGYSLISSSGGQRLGLTDNHANWKRNQCRRKRVKRTRKFNVPEDSERCTAITKKGNQCMCHKMKETNYCITHNKQLNKTQIQDQIQEEQIVKEKSICRSWKNLFGLLK